MPRANRRFLPNHLWHLTRRCHEKTYLPKFARDHRRYALDSSRERDTLTLYNTVLWQINEDAIET